MKKKRIIIACTVIGALAIAGICLFGYARAAQPVGSQKTAWLETTLIAHRGIHDNGTPENSISAFARAIENGNPIELDVSKTKDGQLIVFHDKKLKRMFSADIWLKDITYQELEKYTFEGTDENVPLLSEVLSFVSGRVPLLIEIKNEDEVGDFESAIYEQLKVYDGEFAIQSFNPFTVNWFKENAPEVLRGQLSGSFLVSDYEYEYQGTTRLPWYKKFLLSNLLLNFSSRPNFIAYETENVNAGKLEDLKKLDVPILGWTIDSQEEYDGVKTYFDNFICNKMDITQ